MRKIFIVLSTLDKIFAVYRYYFGQDRLSWVIREDWPQKIKNDEIKWKTFVDNQAK
jgi:hypothetical protein